MTQYIRFKKTNKEDVTVGKLYLIDTDDDGTHHFEDDDGCLRSVKRNGKINKFAVVDVDDVFAEAYNSTFDEDAYAAFVEAGEDDEDEIGEPMRLDTESGYNDSAFVTFYTLDDDDFTFHDITRVDIEERGGAMIAVVRLINDDIRLVPMANVRHMYMSGMH
jgi:hypothetical protein